MGEIVHYLQASMIESVAEEYLSLDRIFEKCNNALSFTLKSKTSSHGKLIFHLFTKLETSDI